MANSKKPHPASKKAHRASVTPNGWTPFGAAYDRRLAEIQAVPESALIKLTLDVHAAIAIVLGALPTIVAMKDRIKNLGDVDQAQIDSLEDYAEAAAEANMRYETAIAPNDEVVAMNDAAVQMRERLRTDAISLSNRGLVDPSQLSAFRGLVGYKNVGFELIGWASVLHDAWPRIENKTPITEEELVEAKQLGERLIRAAGERDLKEAAITEVAHIRHQAVTLMVNAYDQVRRAIAFLRWNEDDLEEIAPSLYGGRVRHAKTDAPAPDSPSTEPVPAPTPAPNAVSAEPAPTHVNGS